MNLPSLLRIVGYVCLVGFVLVLIPACNSSSDTAESAAPANTSVDSVVFTPAPVSGDKDTAAFPVSPAPTPPENPNWPNIEKPAPATDGKVVFDWPSQMKLDETYLIHLAIACNVPLHYLQEQVDSLVVVDADTAGQHRRRRNKTQVKLGQHMKATLMGNSPNDSSVTIVRPPDDDGSRTIDLQTDTSVVWSWNVTPHKAGPMKLTMYLTRVDERDSRPVDVQTILVQGIPPSLYDRVTDALTKLNALWVLLSTGVAGALVKYLRDRWVKSKPAPTTPREQES